MRVLEVVLSLAFCPNWTTLDDVVQRRPLWDFPCRQISLSPSEIFDRYFDCLPLKSVRASAIKMTFDIFGHAVQVNK